MIDYRQFSPDDSLAGRDGLLDEAITRTFLGRAERGGENIELLKDVPSAASSFIWREQRACNLIFDAFANHEFLVPDPWSGEPVKCTFAMSLPQLGALPFNMLPLFYYFESTTGKPFWLINFSPRARITQIYFPTLDLVIHDLGKGASEILVEALITQLAIEPRIVSPRAAAKVVGIIDLLNNFGHQMINDLSGVQRLLDLLVTKNVPEIWLTGPEFFGPIESLFPELQGSVRRLPRWKIAAEIQSAEILPLKLASNIFSRPILHRIQSQTNLSLRTSLKHRPVLAVTLRNDGRRCVNLADVVAEVVRQLMHEFPDIGVILDGYVLPESDLVAGSSVATILENGYPTLLKNEFAVASDLAAKLPPGVLIGNLIGRSMIESIEAMGCVDAYMSHVGTLQHKLGFLTKASGVVHGPRAQLEKIDTGAYQTETGLIPHFLSQNSVEDMPTQSDRGAGFSDYRIVNVDGLTQAIRAAFACSKKLNAESQAV